MSDGERPNVNNPESIGDPDQSPVMEVPPQLEAAHTPRTRHAIGTCLCCGRQVIHANTRQPLHFDCWNEHHSDPTEVWPPGHSCSLGD